jgi:hypothetical protein
VPAHTVPAMSSRADSSKPAVTPRPSDSAPPRVKRSTRAPSPGNREGRFDKAFPVWMDGERGVCSGVGRNITETGLFVETREPLPLGTRVRVTFTAQGGGNTEMTLEAEVRYQCFINFGKGPGARAGMRGIGLKFVAPRLASERKGTTH